MRTLILGLIMAVMSPLARSADANRVTGYICIPDYSTGYSVAHSGKWEPTRFIVKGKKYFLRNISGKWFWTDFGAKHSDPQNFCESFNDQGFMKCHNFEEDVLFNRATLRFQALHPYGYVVSDASLDKEPITPYYQIGTCSPL